MNLFNINWGEALAFAILYTVIISALLFAAFAFWKNRSAFDVRRSMFGVFLLAALCLLTSAPPARALEYVQGIYIDGSTNAVSVGGTNHNRSIVDAFFTNNYNLSTTSSAQADTNSFPAQPVTSPYGLNNRLLTLSGDIQCSAANSGLETFYLAVSANGTRWVSNYTSFSITCNGTTHVPWITNIDTLSYPYVAIQRIGNTNATVTITNTIDAPVSKTAL